MTETAAEAAPAKVNLYLHVTGRRPDGYHLLDSLVVFAAVADRVAATPAEGLRLSLAGPCAPQLTADPANLVLRAAAALRAALPDPPPAAAPGAALVLHKHLPVASGIGGGSADAAATLRLLLRLWGRALTADELAAIALGLGADVPVCLSSRPARMGGVGERLEAAPDLPACGLLLANPGVAVATADVFRARAGGYSAPAVLPPAWPDAAAMASDLRAATANDLQTPALALCPAIGDVLDALAATPGCLLARMSGSGATCFGLYPNAAAAQQARAQLPARGWWSWAGGLHAG